MNPQATGSLAVLASVLGMSFASGVNLYLSVLAVGLGIRFGWLSGVPQELQILANPIVLGIAGVMYLAEFVADKIPFFTPIWDAVHTVIRPAGGALLAMQATADLNPVVQAAATLLGGSVALGAHSSKAGLRLLAHTNPEPVTHSFISVAEDVGVISLIGLAYSYPEVAVAIVLILIILTALFTPVLLRVLRFLLKGISGRVRSWFGGHSADDPYPGWLAADIARMKLPVHPLVLACYSRSGPALSRMRPSYLLHSANQWWLVQKRVIGDNVRNLSDDGVARIGLTKGLVYDVLRLECSGRKRHSFYVTKDWSRAAQQIVDSAPQAARGGSLPAAPLPDTQS